VSELFLSLSLANAFGRRSNGAYLFVQDLQSNVDHSNFSRRLPTKLNSIKFELDKVNATTKMADGKSRWQSPVKALLLLLSVRPLLPLISLLFPLLHTFFVILYSAFAVVVYANFTKTHLSRSLSLSLSVSCPSPPSDPFSSWNALVWSTAPEVQYFFKLSI
jgi:hypothetical protein